MTTVLKRTFSLLWVLCLMMSVCPCDALVEEASQTATASFQNLTEAFMNPDNAARPRTRYWVPEACVDEETLRADIREIAEIGYGGIEVVSYAQFLTDIPEDYQWGTENWENVMEIIVEECKALGLEVSVTNGPSWPVAMPNIESADEEGSSYELTWGVELVVGGGTYSGLVPQRNTTHTEGTTKLISVAAYKLTGKKTLDFDTYTDLNEYVTLDEENNANSTIEWTVPGDDLWMMFSFWEQPTAQKTNNYYVVDHYGIAGAQACIDYWENAISQYDYMSYVSAIFEDSLEVHVDKEWTRGFAEIFKNRKGYDIIPYLPAIGGGDFYNTQEGPNYDYSDPALAEQVLNDYNDVVTYCYTEYHLKPLKELCEKHGMALRAQVAYNKPMNTVSSALDVTIPETEGLNRNSIDFYRLMASGAHMTGSPIYSFEAACEFNSGYSQSYEDLANWFKRAWSAGVNRQVTHGSSYSGKSDAGYNEIYGSVWPGFRAFGGLVTDEWNRNTSNEMARAYLDYFARMNMLLQKTQKVDVAIYYDTFDDDYMTAGGDGEDRYPDGGILNANGYSYEFVSPDTLAHEAAVVTNGRLHENGPAYKAIIVHNEERIGFDGLQRLRGFAEAGLPIVFVGTYPSAEKYLSSAMGEGSDEKIAAICAELDELDNVKLTQTYEDVPQKLAELGVFPDAEYAEMADVLTKHTTDGYADYYYFYNYNKASAADVNATAAQEGTVYPSLNKELLQDEMITVTVQGDGIPCLMDAWSGQIVPISTYETGEGTVTFTLRLAKDAAKVIAVLPDVEALAAEEKTELEPFAISSWDLSIASISQGDTIYFRDSVWNTIEVGEITDLMGWKELDEALASVSGIGTYTAVFDLNACDGAYLDLGEVEDIYTLAVNGTHLPFTDQTDTLVDIGSYVVEGKNTVEVKVATTLFNYAFSIGSARTYPGSTHELFNNGLLGKNGKVMVIPYTKAAVE